MGTQKNVHVDGLRDCMEDIHFERRRTCALDADYVIYHGVETCEDRLVIVHAPLFSDVLRCSQSSEILSR